MKLTDTLIERLDQVFQPYLVRNFKFLEATYFYELILLTDRDFDRISGFGKQKREVVTATLASKGISLDMIKKLQPLLKPPYEKLLLMNEGSTSLDFCHQEMVRLIKTLQF